MSKDEEMFVISLAVKVVMFFFIVFWLISMESNLNKRIETNKCNEVKYERSIDR